MKFLSDCSQIMQIIYLVIVISASQIVIGSDVDQCGGTIEDTNAFISYKLDEYYGPNERCVWTITNRHYDDISVELLSADFADAGDYLELYFLNNTLPRGGPVQRAFRKYHFSPTCHNKLTNAGNKCRIETPILYIVFKSNSYSQGRGFKLFVTFRGIHIFRWKHYYTGINRDDTSGFVDYTQLPFDGYRETKLSWTIAPPVGHPRKNTFTLHKFFLTKFYGGKGSCSIPNIRIYQLESDDVLEPRVIGSSCEIGSPLSFDSNSSEPLIILFQNIIFEKDTQYIQFYWNMEHPPAELSGSFRFVPNLVASLILGFIGWIY